MRWSLLLVLAIGCGPASAVIGEPNGEPIVDEGNAPATDPGTPGTDPVDPGTEPGSPGTDPGDPGPDPTDPTDLSTWTGSRVFDVVLYDGLLCEDEVDEDGVSVTLDPDWEDALAACPDCDEIYQIDVSPDTICTDVWDRGFPVGSPVLRGLELGENGAAVIWALSYDNWRGWRAEPLAEGSLDGQDLTYEYEGDVWGATYTVDGSVAF